MNSQNLNSSAIVTVQMTVEEYLEREAQKTQQQEPAKSRNLVYGLKGIQQLFDLTGGCNFSNQRLVFTHFLQVFPDCFLYK